MLRLCRHVDGDPHPYRQMLMGQSLAPQLGNDMGKNFRELRLVSGRLSLERRLAWQGGQQNPGELRRDDFQTSVDAHPDESDDLREGAG